MSILGLIVSLALFLIAIAVVAEPLLRARKTSEQDDAGLQGQRDRVQIYYERVLTNMRDLDEDFATGKIAEADYRAEREVWAQRGIRLLRVRDGLDARENLITDQGANASAIDEAIEAAISAYRVGAPAETDESAQREVN